MGLAIIGKVVVDLPDITNNVISYAGVGQNIANESLSQEPLSSLGLLNSALEVASLVADGVGTFVPAAKIPAILINLGSATTGYFVLEDDISILNTAIANNTAKPLLYLTVQGDAIGLMSGLFGIIAQLSGPVVGAFFTGAAISTGLESLKIGNQITLADISELDQSFTSKLTSAIAKAQSALVSTSAAGKLLFPASWPAVQASLSAVLADISNIINSKPSDPNFVNYANGLEADFSSTKTLLESLTNSTPAGSQTVTISTSTLDSLISETLGSTTISGSAVYNDQDGLASATSSLSVPGSGSDSIETAEASDVLNPGDTLNGNVTAEEGYTSNASSSIELDLSDTPTSQTFIIADTTIAVDPSAFAEFSVDNNGTPGLYIYSDYENSNIILQSDTNAVDGLHVILENGSVDQNIFDYIPSGLQESPQLSVSSTSDGTFEITALIGAGEFSSVLESDTDVTGVVQKFVFEQPDGELNIANPGSFYGTINNFQPGDVIFLAETDEPIAVSLASGNVLEVFESSGSAYDIQLDPTANFSGETFYTIEYSDGTGILIGKEAPASGSQSLVVDAPVYDDSTSSTSTYSADVEVEPVDLNFAPERSNLETPQTIAVYVTLVGGNFDPNDELNAVSVYGYESEDGNFEASGAYINPASPTGTIDVVAYPYSEFGYPSGDYNGDEVTLDVSYDGGSQTLDVAVNGEIFTPAIALLSYPSSTSFSEELDLGIVHVGQSASVEVTVTNGAKGTLNDVLSSSEGSDGVFTAENSLTSLSAGQSGIVTLSATSDLPGLYYLNGNSVFDFVSQDNELPDESVSNSPVITAEFYNYAEPFLEDLIQFDGLAGSSFVTGGTLTENGNDWNLDFGTLSQYEAAFASDGVVVQSADIGVYSDELAGSIATSGFGFSVDNMPSSFSDEAVLEFALNINSIGENTFFVTIYPSSVDSLSSTPLAPIFLTVTDDILAPSTACFAAGTRILTPRGEIKVEDLKVGQVVITKFGDKPAIKWIGKRHIEVLDYPNPENVLPVCFQADCFADDVPTSDLFLSPDHALYVDGILVPAKALINGKTIYQVSVPKITYYHVELENHSVLFAENTPVESYLDTGNRASFESCENSSCLQANFAQKQREAQGCAPFFESGLQVEIVRERLLKRADIQTTSDPALTVEFNNGNAVIRSRSAVPGLITADPRDRRQLGVKVASIFVGGREVSTAHMRLVEGWHDHESDGRWTDGCAVIPAEILAGAKDVSVILAGTLPAYVA